MTEESEGALKEASPEFLKIYNDFMDELRDYSWVPYRGEYDKLFYDVTLKDGRTWYRCWPNDGRFTDIKTGAVVNGGYIQSIRLCKEQMVE